MHTFSNDKCTYGNNKHNCGSHVSLDSDTSHIDFIIKYAIC